MTAVASLAMYDLPQARRASDALWAAVARRLWKAGFKDVPERLDHARPLEAIWTDPELLLAQTCGYPLVTRLAERVRVVCTPIYAAEGCDGPFHRGAIIVAAGDPALNLAELRGRRCAVNDRGSNTGFNLLRRLIADVAGGAAFLGAPCLVTGSHLASVEAVATRRADFACIDGVTLAHIRREAPGACRGVRILQWTALTPAPPMVTGAATPRERISALHHALRLALRDVTPEVRDTLMLRGFARLRATRYAEIAEIEREAAALRYPDLR